MKLGLISDIHADYRSLCTVLDRLATVHQIARLLCAGDLTGYGTEPNEVLDLFRQSTIATVSGNHDSPSRDITEANATYLRALPMDWRETYGGKTLYMCHGIPGVNIVGFTPGTLMKEAIRNMVSEVRADIVIAGHTHEVLCQQVDGTWILNPGSVYAHLPAWTSHSYATLDLSQSLFTVFDLLRPVSNECLAVYLLE
jgi:putative phosphoesterase